MSRSACVGIISMTSYKCDTSFQCNFCIFQGANKICQNKYEICMFQSQVSVMPNDHDSLELTAPHPIIAPTFYHHAFENVHKFIVVFIFC